ncbi:hypothetical protein CH063_11816 [Colletotrichum higginsianum]|uniref:EC39 protein n=2 Tax=Colletotrichum higginsianum TaxID=80884 RepID=H1VMW8_COLHI|nr:EC39 protein [Colletotrichum higginsianum IMI 349063]OBR03415.1 EC39 protein [Colletotrichum higginsianum IMI 349063]CCF41572.1 hypothetical protein CH063_11816 [Colletotrichum higginsianum]CCF70920.1 EC39 protein [Colletotrichum higginsianum]
MQFLNAILVFASLAVAAAVPAPIEARQAPSPCYSAQTLTWNTGQIPGDGGWIVRIPPLCRYRDNTKYCDSSATKPHLDPAKNTPGRRIFLITAAPKPNTPNTVTLGFGFDIPSCILSWSWKGLYPIYFSVSICFSVFRIHVLLSNDFKGDLILKACSVVSRLE